MLPSALVTACGTGRRSGGSSPLRGGPACRAAPRRAGGGGSWPTPRARRPPVVLICSSASSPRSRKLEAGDRLRVAAVEALGHAQDRRQHADRLAQRRGQPRVLFVRSLRRAAPVIAGDQRDDLDLVGIEAAQVAVLDQVVRVPVMALVADVRRRCRAAAPRYSSHSRSRSVRPCTARV